MGKDKTYAWISFILFLFFWAPILNIILFLLSIYFAIKQIRLVRENPEIFGGLWFSVICAILSFLGLVSTAIILFYSKKYNLI